MEADNLIEFSPAENDGAGEAATARNGDPTIRPSAAAGDTSARPLQRRLLLKAGDSRITAPTAPSKRQALQSLGDDSAILDAILGNILRNETNSAADFNDSRDQLLSNSGDFSSSCELTSGDFPSAITDVTCVSLPSAPPMEADWQAPGPSGCHRPLSSSSSSTYSSTLSLSKLDLSIIEPTTTPILNALRRGGARSTVIGGLPFGRRTCRCSGEVAEVSCSAERCRRVTSFRRPRSADGRRFPPSDVDVPSEPRLDPSKTVGSSNPETTAAQSTSAVVATAPPEPPSPVQRTASGERQPLPSAARQPQQRQQRQQNRGRRQVTAATPRTRRTTTSEAPSRTNPPSAAPNG
ncbi:Hypothetical protein NTJ_13821 [Nesidiocoris tenuis]|uniref:Uncharacterized protein n=1 Tax=Nesidiocoris tenuis TaxID=355587 RepID=A0ABN7B9D5_9HEMI|nr:Hypothetical protein NTJ_13821 [Nesidiocoris tenuis]